MTQPFKLVDGVEIPLTAEEIAARAAEEAAYAAQVFVPQNITARQFFIAAGNAGIISKVEAIAAASTGAVPDSVEAVFAALPDDQEYVARVTWSRMTTISRNDPLLVGLGAAFGLSNSDIDNLFISAAEF